MTDEAAERLETHRRGRESFSQFALRVAAVLDESEDGTTVTEPKRSGESDLLTTEEFAARMDELLAQLPPRTADELETRFR
jgi:DNA-directed RNA polymerase specialized sigma24 family protein